MDEGMPEASAAGILYFLYSGGSMKHAKGVILYVCIVLFIAAAAIFPVSGAGKTGYVALGDSIAAGYGLDSPAKAYPSLLAEELDLSLTNLAVNGQTSEGLKSQLAGLSKKEKRAVSDAALITISIGGNDLIGEENRRVVLTEALIAVLSGDYTMSEEMEEIYRTLKENIISIVSSLRALNPDAVILLQTLYNPYLIGDYTYLGYNIGDELDFYVQKVNETYAQALAESGGFVIVDTAGQMNGVAEYFYTTFDFHPTAAGHAAIAKILADAYRDIRAGEVPSGTAQTTGPAAASETTAPDEPAGGATDSTGEDACISETQEPQTEAAGSGTASIAPSGETIAAAAQPGPDSPESPDYSGIVLIITAAIFFAAVLFLFLRGLKRGKRT